MLLLPFFHKEANTHISLQKEKYLIISLHPHVLCKYPRDSCIPEGVVPSQSRVECTKYYFFKLSINNEGYVILMSWLFNLTVASSFCYCLPI